MKIPIEFLAHTPITPGDYKLPIRATLPDGQTFESYASVTRALDGHQQLNPPADEQGERLRLEANELISSGGLKPLPPELLV